MSREKKAAKRQSAESPRPAVVAPKKAAKRPKSAEVLRPQADPAHLRAKLEDLAAELESPALDRQAWAERLETMNEELQATNEELLTSNEELQSLTEQLEYANQQLDSKVRELEAANDDISNLLYCSNIAVLFLDRALRIKLFTAKATEMFSLTPGDVGRPIAHLVPKFCDPAWERDAAAVLECQAARESEVRGDDGRWYARRMEQYCTRDHRSEGVVVTFADITGSKVAAEAVAERFEAVVESSADAIFSKDLWGTIRTWNRGAQRLYGYTAQEAVGKSIRLIVPEDRTDELAQILKRVEQGESIEQLETERLCKDGHRVTVSLTISPLHERQGKVVGAAVTARNVTEQKLFQQSLRENEERLRHLSEQLQLITDATGAPMARCSRDLRYLWVNKPYAEWLKRSPDEIVGRPIAEILGEETFEQLLPYFNSALSGQQVRYEQRLNMPRVGLVWVSVTYAPTLAPDGAADGWVAVILNLDDRKRAEQALEQRASQQAAVASLGQRALAEPDFTTVLDDAVRTVATVLDVEYCKLLELLPGGRELLLRAGVGWRANLVGLTTVSAGRESQAGYTLSSGGPVVVENLGAETRFHPPPLLLDHGVVSGMSCAVAGCDGQAYGVLGAHTSRSRQFTEEDVHFLESVANLLGSLIQSKQLEDELRNRELRLRAIVNTAADAILTIDNRGTIETVNPAAERLFGYSGREMVGQNVKMLMPAPYRDEHDQYLTRYLASGEKRIIDIGRQLEARRKDGSVFPVDLAVSEVEPRRRFTGIIRDITRRKELEREIVEIASLEQRRIGQDLHDSVGQELTALNILAQDLSDALRTDPLNAPMLVRQIVKGLQRSQRELRAVLRGLLPVAVDSEGLMASLSDLADRVRGEGKAACTFECAQPVSVGDTLVATHLYLIAQEAVHNALKHANARSIRISLSSDDRLTLRVQDDGSGISTETSGNSGLGLRIMYNRAAIIGAALMIKQTQPKGTAVICALPRRNYAPKKAEESEPSDDHR
jgi:two-component system, LuxR family, sensor kinase FixL